MMSGVRQVIKPSDCIMAFGIPTSRQAFAEALANPTNRDFVVNCCPVWEKYYYEVVSEIESIEPVIRSLGAKVVHNITLNDFGELFKQQPYAIILFCHWQEAAVEFADGLAPVPAVIDRVPVAFSGFLDLCICHPESLAVTLHNTRPNCLTKFIPGVAIPSYWLYFYWGVFKTLKDSDTSYMDALETTIRAFLSRRKN
jgi:hypothetical protein